SPPRGSRCALGRPCGCARSQRRLRLRVLRITLSTMSSEAVSHPHATPLGSRVRQFYALTKPRVVQLIVFCAFVGMLLAEPGVPPLLPVLAASLGIWLVAAAAAAF